MTDFTPHDDFSPPGSALLFLVLSVTLEVLPSRRAAPINFLKNTAFHSKKAEEKEIPKEVTYKKTSETSKTVLSCTNPVQGSAVFTQSTQLVQVPLMYFVTRLLPMGGEQSLRRE
ncbi:hypothetical protein pdam_00024845 [Pocillopora damicornis]|uniref:Uncharacterized protein n=1 Tax=Pocillopora damicornis TaxID=46731 RepID=A0A3M6TBF2_POCDA|nr:hypothetical protein pdam_00024845 [Pocillopora damicornis]